jgi:hypothetical protein
MPQYLVAIYLPDDFDPSVQDKATERDIDVLNEEMEALGSGFSLAACARQATRSRCGHSPTARCSSPTGPTWRLRST